MASTTISNYSLRLMLSLLSLFLVNGLLAQTSLTERLTDVSVPNDASLVLVDLKGGDGGNATVTGVSTGKCLARGGAGATVKAIFKIGSSAGQIPAGSTLRFIRGEKGESEVFAGIAGAGDAGGAGGGGSAVLYREAGSTSNSDWKILANAGGGGGGYTGAFAFICTDKNNGRGGRSLTSGGTGKLQSGTSNTQGGEDGEAGEDILPGAGGGGGATGAADNPANGAGAQAGGTEGGAGGHCAGCETGGWGFGAGGFAFYGPGGGGGYSGGGAGSIDYAGGGGSYVSSMHSGAEITAGNDGGGQETDGLITYEFDPSATEYEELLQYPIKLSNAGKCIATYNNASGKGTNVELVTCTGSKNQDWKFYDGVIKLANNLGTCLDLYSSNTTNGSNIQLTYCNGTNAQKWIYDVNNQFLRSKVNTSKCLDLHNASTADGTNIQLYTCGGEKNQQWTISGVTSSMREGEQLRIHFAKDPSKCLDFEHAATTNGTNIMLYNCHYTDSQYLKFDGEQIKMWSSGKCVDVNSSKTANGTNVQLYACNGSDAQKWIYDGFTNTFRSKLNLGKCLDVSGGSTSNGANIQLWNCNDSDAQKWYFYK